MKLYVSEHEGIQRIPALSLRQLSDGDLMKLSPRTTALRLHADDDCIVKIGDAGFPLSADTTEWFEITQRNPVLTVGVEAMEE